MVSALDRCKRALVSLLKTLAGICSVTVNVSRKSSDKDVSTAFRKLLRKTNPEHGGRMEHQRDFNKAHDAWEGAKKAAKDKHGGVRCAGGVADGAGITPTVRELRATEKKNFRFDDTLGG